MASLSEFKHAATKDEREELSQAVGTTENYLFYHLGKHRDFSLDHAVAVEQATREIAMRNGGITPEISRTDLCSACAKCPLACATRNTPEGA